MSVLTRAIPTIVLLGLALPVLAAETLPKLPQGDAPAARQDDAGVGRSYSVTCYLGNPEEGKDMGNLTVTAVDEAGPACNATFYDCHGGCYGCLTNGESLCVDRSGKKYQR